MPTLAVVRNLYYQTVSVEPTRAILRVVPPPTCDYRPRVAAGERRPRCGAPVEPGTGRCHPHRRPWLKPIDPAIWYAAERQYGVLPPGLLDAFAALLASAEVRP
jgi:hypothetical protein